MESPPAFSVLVDERTRVRPGSISSGQKGAGVNDDVASIFDAFVVPVVFEGAGLFADIIVSV